MSSLVVFGANSEIFQGSVPFLISKGISRMVWIGGDRSLLERNRADVTSRYAGVEVELRVLKNYEDSSIEEALSSLKDRLFDYAVVASGVMRDQKDAMSNSKSFKEMIDANCFASLLAVQRLSRLVRCGGTLLFVTSVAADRARRYNYCYGATKAMASYFLEGLRADMSIENIKVVDFKAGPTKTKMTIGHKSALLVPAATTGKKLASSLFDKDGVVYSSWLWSVIMLVFRFMPFSLLKRLKF